MQNDLIVMFCILINIKLLIIYENVQISACGNVEAPGVLESHMFHVTVFLLKIFYIYNHITYLKLWPLFSML